MVNAQAYGYDDKKVVETLSSIGVKLFVVSNNDEVIYLRQVTDGEILTFDYILVYMAQEIVSDNIMQALLSEKYAKRLIPS